MHIHPWNTPPLQGNSPVVARQTFLRNLPSDVILAKLESVYTCFTAHGLRPASFRGGRYSSGGQIHEFLRDKGFLADTSIVPYTTWADDGAPDYRDAGLEPVRLPPRYDGDRPFWLLPLTLGFTRRPFSFWQKCYERVGRSWLRRLRLIGLAERLGVVRKVWLNFECAPGGSFLPFIRQLRHTELPYVCFTIHSSSLVAGKGPYTRTHFDEDHLFAQIELVFRTLAEWPDMRSATVREVATTLEDQHHARTRHQSA
jgi:hypothetical protein